VEYCAVLKMGRRSGKLPPLAAAAAACCDRCRLSTLFSAPPYAPSTLLSACRQLHVLQGAGLHGQLRPPLPRVDAVCGEQPARLGWAAWEDRQTDRQTVPRRHSQAGFGAAIIPGSLAAAAGTQSHTICLCCPPCRARRSSTSSRKPAPAAASTATSEEKAAPLSCLDACPGLCFSRLTLFVSR
jgi:hypothetical protein